MRVFVALAVLAASVYLILTTAPRLGLDLRGGTQIVLQAKDSPQAKADAPTTDRALEVLRRRVDQLGVAEPTLARSGENRIIIELPGVQDPRQAVEVIGRTAQLTFHPVISAQQPGAQPKPGQKVLATAEGEQLVLGPAALTGEGVSDANSGPAPDGPGYVVSINFQSAGGAAWGKLTGQAACAPMGSPVRRVAIALDDKIISAPEVNPQVGCNVGILGGSTQITGKFTNQQAGELALLIKGGALPVPVEVVEQRTVGPTLGADAIRASLEAGVIGLALTALFLIVVYRLAGLISVIALVGYSALSYAMLLFIGATLTLPGLAGLVLAIGMAVDSTVLVFERTREEFLGTRTRQPLPKAIDRGFGNALSAIVDSNITTLLAAGLLFWLATGPVKGFGVTLTIGVLGAMFATLVLTRALLFLAVRGPLAKHPKLTGLAHHGVVRRKLEARDPKLYDRAGRWLIGSAIVLVLLFAGVFVRGLNLGVEFTGGRVLEYSTGAAADARDPLAGSSIDIEKIRLALTDAGFPRAIVQASNQDAVTVRTEPTENTAPIRDAVAKAAGKAEQIRDEKIGPSLGAELRNNALIALLLAVLAQLAYLAYRFDWRLGAATVLALSADVLIVLGTFAWMDKTLDAVFLAAMLTVIGYSVNDSVVVFDRVRELRGLRPKESFARVSSAAVLQTLPRTVNTGIGVIFVLGALLALGGGSLADFALAMLLGLVAGTLSTIVTAAPIAVLLDKRWPGAGKARTKKKSHYSTPAHKRDRTGAVV
ncbi:protein translocase subunit SecD [Allokutzneria multivorans]|uniref:protein translocase subunit SecD n=1 Tax=Allokutzneria multivorans TaxID=1142134 RepID=UPI0031EC2B51